MAILTLGISFRRAPIELLERLAFADDDLTKAYRVADDLDGLEGAVVLSTCNRVEVYGEVASYHAGFLALKRLLLETRGIAAEELVMSYVKSPGQKSAARYNELRKEFQAVVAEMTKRIVRKK